MIAKQEEKVDLFDAINTMPTVKAKAKWFDTHSSGCHAKRLLVQAIVEGVFFSASFAYIFYIKQCTRFGGKFPGLVQSNSLISRDEGLHRDFSLMLYKRSTQLPLNEVHQLVKEAVQLEQEFIRQAFKSGGLLGLNANSLCQYIEFVADHLLKSTELPSLFNQINPLDFMDRISMESKVNFFEARNDVYQVPEVSLTELSFDAEF